VLHMSVISSTDVECFLRLSNPEVVDLTANAASSRQIAQQMRDAMEKAVASTASGRGGEDSDEEGGRGAEAPAARPPPRQASSLSSAISALRSSSAAEAPPGRSAAAPSSLPVQAAPPPAAARPLSRIEEEASSEEEEPPEPPAAKPAPPAGPKDPETVRLEKQGVLLELQSLETKGVKLTRSFSMADGLTEMEFELQKQTSLLNTASAVQNMKDVLRLGLNGMELANAKLGPFICMEGWAESLTSDMKRFDAPLEKLYKRYWRKASMSPIMELGMIILGSLAMHHFKTKIFGRIAAPPPPPREEPAYGRGGGGKGGGPPPVARPRPRPAPPVPSAPPSDARARRPVLRSPTSLLGL